MAEIQFVLAENFDKLPAFLAQLDELQYGGATRTKMRAIFDSTEKNEQLRLQLAGMLDMRGLVKTTYELEGDRLELLLVYDRIEALRAFGETLRKSDGHHGVLPNLGACLQAQAKLKNGLVISKYFTGIGQCEAEVIGSRMVDSTLYPGQKQRAYRVRYSVDDQEQEFEEHELRPLIKVSHLPQWRAILQKLIASFDYLESRITGTCETSSYSCAQMYNVCKLSRIFNPMFAAMHLTPETAEAFVEEVKPIKEHINLQLLLKQLHTYLARAAEVNEVDQSDVQSFTNQVLNFWKATPKDSMSEWRKAARIVFSMSPNSASCEECSLCWLACMETNRTVLWLITCKLH